MEYNPKKVFGEYLSKSWFVKFKFLKSVLIESMQLEPILLGELMIDKYIPFDLRIFAKA